MDKDKTKLLYYKKSRGKFYVSKNTYMGLFDNQEISIIFVKKLKI
jgi:hypothetical protein